MMDKDQERKPAVFPAFQNSAEEKKLSELRQRVSDLVENNPWYKLPIEKRELFYKSAREIETRMQRDYVAFVDEISDEDAVQRLSQIKVFADDLIRNHLSFLHFLEFEEQKVQLYEPISRAIAEFAAQRDNREELIKNMRAATTLQELEALHGNFLEWSEYCPHAELVNHVYNLRKHGLKNNEREKRALDYKKHSDEYFVLYTTSDHLVEEGVATSFLREIQTMMAERNLTDFSSIANGLHDKEIKKLTYFDQEKKDYLTDFFNKIFKIVVAGSLQDCIAVLPFIDQFLTELDNATKAFELKVPLKDTALANFTTVFGDELFKKVKNDISAREQLVLFKKRCEELDLLVLFSQDQLAVIDKILSQLTVQQAAPEAKEDKKKIEEQLKPTLKQIRINPVEGIFLNNEFLKKLKREKDYFEVFSQLLILVEDEFFAKTIDVLNPIAAFFLSLSVLEKEVDSQKHIARLKSQAGLLLGGRIFTRVLQDQLTNPSEFSSFLQQCEELHLLNTLFTPTMVKQIQAHITHLEQEKASQPTSIVSQDLIDYRRDCIEVIEKYKRKGKESANFLELLNILNTDVEHLIKNYPADRKRELGYSFDKVRYFLLGEKKNMEQTPPDTINIIDRLVRRINDYLQDLSKQADIEQIIAQREKNSLSNVDLRALAEKHRKNKEKNKGFQSNPENPINPEQKGTQ